MDADNPIDELKKIIPFEEGPDDSQTESKLKASILESIISTDPRTSLRSRMRKSLAGIPLWRRPRLVIPSFATLTIMGVLILSTTTSSSALAEVSKATENSVNAKSGVVTTLFEIVDPANLEVKFLEKTILRYEEDNYSLVHPDFEIRGVDGLEYINKDGEWIINETLRKIGIKSSIKNSKRLKDFPEGGKDFRKISSNEGKGRFRGKIPAKKIFDIREINISSEAIDLAEKAIADKPNQTSSEFTVEDGFLTEVLIEVSVSFPGSEPHLLRIKKTFTEHGVPQNINAPELENVTKKGTGLLCLERLDECEYLAEIKILEELEKRRPGLCKTSPPKALSRFEMMLWIENHHKCLLAGGEKDASDAFIKIVQARLRFGI